MLDIRRTFVSKSDRVMLAVTICVLVLVAVWWYMQ